MSPNASPARLSKRSRASDAALDMTQTKKEGVKRRRTSTIKDGFSERLEPANALEISTMSSGHDTQIALNMQDKAVAAPSDSWSLSRSIAGRFTNLDPILTPDEQYLFLALKTAVHIYSVATSRLFRVLKIDSADSIIGYRISSRTQEHLYIFTSSGRVSEWDWPSNKQIAHWATHHRTISADLVHKESESNAKDAHILLYSLRERKDGKRELAVVPLNSEEAHITVLLEANAKIGDFRIVGNGQAIVAYGGAHIFVGSASSSRNLELSNYTWREIKLASKITCIDIKQDGLSQQHRPHASEDKKVSEFDLALGGADGSILIYHDALAFLGVGVDSEEDKKPAPRRLHWHRDPVRAVRWSKDGNYVISGGHESVMVLWQLDTGRKQFLPHLSSPICNIVVSGSGNSYAVKLADNRTVVLSARELQPLATVTGLQFCARTPKVACQANLQSSSHTSRAIAAVLHPQHPDQLLVTVPATHQLTQEGITSLSAPILQTYDIRSNTHISRQALARTNATTLNIGPDGTQILTPDIKQLGVSHDGKWMATVDSWSPHPQDLEALDLGNSVLSELEEIYLKFWRWNDSSCIWELVTRIDRPHLSDKCSALVLDISPRPQSHEFATIGSDALLRLWRPVVRQRPGLKRNSSGQVPETWKCRNAINLKGYLEICNADSARLSSASVCFSEDGSVLAVCLHSASTNPGVIVLIDVRSCSVRYNRAGVYSGDICAASFLGFQLVIVTQKSVFVWDTVNDIVRATDPPVSHWTGDSSSRLLAVNPRTHTFAVTSTKRASSKKSRKSGFMVQVYDIHSLSSRCHFKLSKEPVALLSNVNVAEYIIVDAGANIHQLGSANKSVQASYTNDLDEYPAFGLENLFGHQATRNNTTKTSTSAVSAGLITQPSERIGLAGVFGDTPPFVLPPSHIVFCDLVKALSA